MAGQIQKIVLVSFGLFIAAGCNNPKRLSSIFPGEKWNHLTKVKGIQTIPGTRAESMEIQYLGCGGLIVRTDSTSILFDPFFSNPSLGRVILGTLWRTMKSDRMRIQAGLKKINDLIPGGLQQTKAIFLSHSHYDHLMDVPAIQEEIKIPPLVFLNQSGANTCARVIAENQRRILSATTNPIIIPTKNGFFEIYPIPGEHNPHAAGIKFFAGGRKKELRYFTNPYQKTRSWVWREGQTFNFLVDFKDQTGKIQTRIYIQSNSCDPKLSNLPGPELLALHPVDVAFLGVASYHFSENYPGGIVDHLKPKTIAWIHWEDFFEVNKHGPRTVRQTHVKRFLNTYSSTFSTQFLPIPGAGFIFHAK